MASEEDNQTLLNIGDNGRVTIPADVRRQLDTKLLRVEIDDNGIITLEPAKIVSKKQRD